LESPLSIRYGILGFARPLSDAGVTVAVFGERFAGQNSDG
jgi:hypothetical protein